MSFDSLFETYRKSYRKIKCFQDITSVLHWDSEVMMPEDGREYRSQQLAALSELTHEWMTSAQFQKEIDQVAEASQALSPEKKEGITRELLVLLEDKKRAEKLPADFVAELARCSNLAHAEWAKAKKEKDFSIFAPRLKELVSLSRKQADYYGYTTEPYDAHLETYEKGANASSIAELFSQLKENLIPLVQSAPKFSIPFKNPIPISYQKSFCQKLPELLGLPKSASRLDESSHPFSTSLGNLDKRITTRYSESDPLSSIFGVLHETGHSLYEAGISQMPDWPNPLTEFLSLGVHESQSRLWENQVGRSRSFWEFMYPILLSDFHLKETELPFESLYTYINSTEKSKIRVEADQLTYNLHIILRFEIERDLINGKIDVDDLPKIWNTKMKESFGLSIDNDSEGVLQDIHWSMGAFGYFPTYTLGNIYSAQLFHAFEKEFPMYMDDFSKNGDFSKLLHWLRKNVHTIGKRISVDQMFLQATGEKPNVKFLIDYLTQKSDEMKNEAKNV